MKYTEALKMIMVRAKMRRYFLAALAFALLLVSSLSVIVYAHPGGTDSFGGHRNHSTGTYHYHHGYPEHAHRDMDGDGLKDCPYDFHDKTGWNSGSSSSAASPKQKITLKTILLWIFRIVLYIAALFASPFILIYIVCAILAGLSWLFSLFKKNKKE